MRVTAEVLTAEPYEYSRKGGEIVKGAEVTFLDRCPVSPMKDTFDMRLDGEKADNVNATLKGKRVDVNVSKFEIWSGRLRAHGKLAEMKPAQTSK